jgi:pimeloyl-ACP methyl ester carboxylesterase
METVRSADGIPIAFDRGGDGPALVLTMGAFCDRTSTTSLAALLATNYTVYEYDRRGRGSSGNSPVYSIEREVEDLAAVIGAAGGRAYVFGHSSGGALALEAAARGVPITKLAVWEPPYTADNVGDGGSSEMLEDVGGRVAAGDNDSAAEVFISRTGTPPEVLESIKRSPAWPRMRDLAPTLLYDLMLCNHGFVPVERLGSITTPTVAFAGGASPAWADRATRLVAGAIPGADQFTVDGQSHAPADEILAPLLTEFFRG